MGYVPGPAVLRSLFPWGWGFLRASPHSLGWRRSPRLPLHPAWRPGAPLLSLLLHPIIAMHTGFLLYTDAANVRNHSSGLALRSWKQEPLPLADPQFPGFGNRMGSDQKLSTPFPSSVLRFCDFCHRPKRYLLIL